MSKLIKLAAKNGNMNKEACLMALRSQVESKDDDFGWGYLDNAYAIISEYVSPAQWAGYLSALKADGLYKSDLENKSFGRVKLAA